MTPAPARFSLRVPSHARAAEREPVRGLRERIMLVRPPARCAASIGQIPPSLL